MRPNQLFQYHNWTNSERFQLDIKASLLKFITIAAGARQDTLILLVISVEANLYENVEANAGHFPLKYELR